MGPPPSLTGLASTTRSLYERLLLESIGSSATRGSCLYAAILLQSLVEKFLPMTARVRGGDGHADGGFVATDGSRHGHYWIEVTCSQSREAWVVDITADQFGEPAVRVLPLNQASQYVPGDQDLVDEHVRDETPA